MQPHETPNSVLRDLMADKEQSKSQRVRDYLQANPDAANLDVVAALQDYGVRYGDVTSVKNQMKKKAGKAGAKGNGRTKAAKKAAGAKRKSPGRPARAKSTATSTATSGGMPAIQAGVRFVEEAGGIKQADEILSLIRTIRQG